MGGGCLCDASVSPENNLDSAFAGIPQRTEGNLAVAPDWRNEVALRLEAYRVRRKKLCTNSAQSDLPFEESVAQPQELSSAPATPRRLQPLSMPAVESRRRRSSVERMEIDLAQPVLDFAAAEYGHVRKETAALTVPVAPLGERLRAALLDISFLLFAYAAFLAMFSAVGGHWTVSKLDFAVTLATLALFYAQYFTLFILCGGTTPGMRLRGLRVAACLGPG